MQDQRLHPVDRGLAEETGVQPQKAFAPVSESLKISFLQHLPSAGNMQTGMVGVAAQSCLLPAHLHAYRNISVQSTPDWGKASIRPFAANGSDLLLALSAL